MTCVSVGRGLAFGGDTFFSQVSLDVACANKVGKYLYCCGYYVSRLIHVDIIKSWWLLTANITLHVGQVTRSSDLIDSDHRRSRPVRAPGL